MKSIRQLEQEAQRGECSLTQYCAEVATMFRVRLHEVAVLELRRTMLHFVYPPELRKTGLIPLISSSQAARTATSKRSEIFNNFAAVRHSSVFETVKVGGESGQAIQRLMSAPIVSPEGDVLGVIQISRKGATPLDAGAEFEMSDLHTLREVSDSFGRVARQLLDASTAPPTKVEVEPGQILTR